MPTTKAQHGAIGNSANAAYSVTRKHRHLQAPLARIRGKMRICNLAVTLLLSPQN
jgi:hypothetical protein